MAYPGTSFGASSSDHHYWNFWTHHTLTKGDQEWFFALEKNRFPELKLELLTATDIEDLLIGPGALLRETYFGELVLTPALLAGERLINHT